MPFQPSRIEKKKRREARRDLLSLAAVPRPVPGPEDTDFHTLAAVTQFTSKKYGGAVENSGDSVQILRRRRVAHARTPRNPRTFFQCRTAPARAGRNRADFPVSAMAQPPMADAAPTRARPHHRILAGYPRAAPRTLRPF